MGFVALATNCAPGYLCRMASAMEMPSSPLFVPTAHTKRLEGTLVAPRKKKIVPNHLADTSKHFVVVVAIVDFFPFVADDVWQLMQDQIILQQFLN